MYLHKCQQIFFGQKERCADNRMRVQLAGCDKMLKSVNKTNLYAIYIYICLYDVASILSSIKIYFSSVCPFKVENVSKGNTVLTKQLIDFS